MTEELLCKTHEVKGLTESPFFRWVLRMLQPRQATLPAVKHWQQTKHDGHHTIRRISSHPHWLRDWAVLPQYEELGHFFLEARFPQPSSAEVPSVQGPNIKIIQNQSIRIFSTEAQHCKRTQFQKAAGREASYRRCSPSCLTVYAETLVDEQQWSRS